MQIAKPLFFLAVMAWPACFLAHGAAPGGETAAAKRPNIVFILTDDQRWDAMGCVGRPWLQTPNMDRLAAGGILFQNAFVTTSLCSPARASFLSGRYVHNHNVYANNGVDLAHDVPTYPQHLQAAGYETAFIGKWHMKNIDTPRPGFDRWTAFRGQGFYFDCPLNVDGQSVKAEQYITDELNERALAFLRQKHEKPFLLVLSHKAVHAPFAPAPRHENLYDDIQPESYDDPDDVMADKPKYIRDAAEKRRGGLPALPSPGKNYLNYMRTLSAVDDGIGAILDTLDELGIAQDTAVIFAGDNGYFFGEHGGLGDKRKPYEEALRIPLLMRYPRLGVPEGKRETALVLNIDLAPTILELAGLPPDPGMDGQSWLGVVAGKAPGRERFLYEYFEELKYASSPTSLGVRTKRYKYTQYPLIQGEVEELYDVAQDPRELVNLAGKPEFAETLAEMRDMLEELKAETRFKMPEGIPFGPPPAARPNPSAGLRPGA